MGKIHTRQKRRWGLSTHLRHYYFFYNRKRKKRPKTFKTKEAANKWALENGLKPEGYFLKKVKRNKRIQIVMKDG